MTPQQQAALESVAGRALSAAEFAEIDPLLPARNDVAIAAVLSAGRVRVESRMINVGSVLDVLGPADGAAVLDALEALKPAVPAVRWAFVLLERGELDVGLASTRGQIDALTGVVFSPAQAAAIKGLAEQPDPIAVGAVSDALNIAEGRLTL